MEGQIESSYRTGRYFLFLPILCTLFTNNLRAERPILPNLPILVTKNLSYSAVPIMANTLAAIDNLKSLNAIKAEEMTRAEMAYTAAETETKTFKMSELAVEEKRKFVANFAESHTDLGYNYRYGGNTVEKGIDCSGFTKFVLGYFDFKASRTSNEQFENGAKVPVSMAKAGDLVFFGSKKYINHVAVVVSNDEKGLFIVHSCNRGIVKENVYESSYWKSKLKDMAVNIIDNQEVKSKK
jgi:cell wall-associated NlpC family hydrolase